jgi:3-dehydroquinate dehydratase-1
LIDILKKIIVVTMFHQTMICVPIFKSDLNSAQEAADNALKLGADILELRIDALKNPDVDKIINFMDNLECKIIATNRMAGEGGLFKGSEAERTGILRDVAGYADYVDIELQTDENLQSKVIEASKFNIISYHDFEKTPSVEELLKIVELEKEKGDIAKFAVMPQSMGDTLIVLKALSQVKNTIGISMGDLGSYTRVIAPLFGSPITFASLDNVSAPGQIDIESTRLFLHKFGGE